MENLDSEHLIEVVTPNFESISSTNLLRLRKLLIDRGFLVGEVRPFGAKMTGFSVQASK